MNYFSSNLKHLREQKKLSQNKLAEMASVNQSTIVRWETGDMSPSLDNIYDIAKALNISVADLTGKDLTTINKNDLDDEMFFNKYKMLSEEDKELIRNLTETRRKQIDKELGED